MKLTITLFTFLLLVVSGSLSAQIYKWTDESGRVHFSDKAAEGAKAETVKLKINSYEHVSYEALPDDFFASKNESKKVVMYSTAWCGYCKKARAYFNAQGIAFSELDIERDAEAKRQYDSLGGRGVPVILVGEKRMNGFSVAGFDNIYK